MALRVNYSSTSGIPDSIIRDMTDLNLQFPEKWQGGWVASLVSSHQNDDWVEKLANEDGVMRHRTLSGHFGQHNSASVCAGLLALRDEWKK
jgi:hypothetical protein